MNASSLKPLTTAQIVGVSMAALVVFAAAFGLQRGASLVFRAATAIEEPETLTIAPRAFSYRASGEFRENGFEKDAPMVTVPAAQPLTIMKYQVSWREYAHCVAEGACAAAEPDSAVPAGGDAPVTGVSLDDALAYAAWLSRQTGVLWRLPTDAEFAFAAGDRFPDDALGIDSDNPAERWLADYRREAARKASSDPTPQPRGHFGENALGLADFAGNVWEWTATCHRKVTIGTAQQMDAGSAACGIHVVVGRHRAPMSSFIRSPKGGGCSVGAPPDNLGFRLVRETPWHEPLLRLLRAAS